MSLLKNYQHFTRTTAVYPKDQELIYLALGLASEAGEVAGKVKKIIRDKEDLTDGVLDEMGDCLWYMAQLCNYFGVSFNDLIFRNTEKLTKRKKSDTLHGSGDER